MRQSSVGTKRFLTSKAWIFMALSAVTACAPREDESYRQQPSQIISPYGQDQYGNNINEPQIAPEPQVYSGALPPLTGEPIPPSGVIAPPSSGSLVGGMGSSMPRSPFETRKQTPIPADGVHLVESGQTIYEIARQYGVDTADIIAINRLKPPYNVQAGEALYLTPEALRKETGIKVKLKQDELSTAQPTPEGQDKFAENLDDTLHGIGGHSAPATASAQAKPAPSGQNFDNILGDLNLPSPLASGETVAEETPSAPVKQPTKTAANTPAKATPEKASPKPVLKNPVEGKIAARFGEKFDGKKVNGVVYTGSENGLVKSVGAGKVMYVGEAQGYGQVVLVRHDGGVMTNYANLKKVLVKQGQSIEAGGLIGKIGSTAVSKTPQLTFEVREGSKAIDPEKYLR